MREEKFAEKTAMPIADASETSQWLRKLATFRRNFVRVAYERDLIMTETILDHDLAPPTSAALATGVLAGTLVLTLEGEIPVQFLAPGDRVITRAGASRLVKVAVHVVETAQVVRIVASALGHGRPDTDTVVALQQPILVRDWRAMALYGTPEAAVPAERLADGDYIRRDTLLEARFFTLHFAAEAVIYAGGLEMACPPVPVAP